MRGYNFKMSRDELTTRENSRSSTAVGAAAEAVSQRWRELTRSRAGGRERRHSEGGGRRQTALVFNLSAVLEVICAGQASLNLTRARNISQARKEKEGGGPGGEGVEGWGWGGA